MSQNGSAPKSTPLSNGTEFTSLLTNVHLIWVAILAMVVIIGIIYGSKLKQRRKAAERQVVEHTRQAGAVSQASRADIGAEGSSSSAATPTAIASEGAAGPVTQLKGLGPKVASRLAELGVTTVGQLAALDHDAAVRLDADLGSFSGRMERDRWIEQARFLAAGDVKGFEAVFGRL